MLTLIRDVQNRLKYIGLFKWCFCFVLFVGFLFLFLFLFFQFGAFIIINLNMIIDSFVSLKC